MPLDFRLRTGSILMGVRFQSFRSSFVILTGVPAPPLRSILLVTQPPTKRFFLDHSVSVRSLFHLAFANTFSRHSSLSNSELLQLAVPQALIMMLTIGLALTYYTAAVHS